MSVQIIIPIVTLILGSILTMIVNHVSQLGNNKTEKKKMMREKIEELYMLTNQTKAWAKIQIWRRHGLEKLTFDYVSVLDFWYLDDVTPEGKYTREIECPINRMEMLVALYLPSLKKEIERYRTSINLIQFIAIAKNPLKIIVDGVSEIDLNSAEHLEGLSKEDMKDMEKWQQNISGEDILKSITEYFELSHKLLQVSLELYLLKG